MITQIEKMGCGGLAFTGLAMFGMVYAGWGLGWRFQREKSWAEAVKHGAARWEVAEDGSTTFKWNTSLDSKSPDYIGPPRDWYEDQMRLKALWESQQESK